MKKKRKVLLFTTKIQKAYDSFLTNLDESFYEILGISTSMIEVFVLAESSIWWPLENWINWLFLLFLASNK